MYQINYDNLKKLENEKSNIKNNYFMYYFFELFGILLTLILNSYTLSRQFMVDSKLLIFDILGPLFTWLAFILTINVNALDVMKKRSMIIFVISSILILIMRFI